MGYLKKDHKEIFEISSNDEDYKLKIDRTKND
jgi:hypothetical protein